jgi:glycosyltransferase involved in cell wall biosynthesis
VTAPLRIARGVQNKILEAMAMGRPVVAASSCGASIDARAGEHLLSAETEPQYLSSIESLLSEPARAAAMGAAGRRRVQERYSWSASLNSLDAHLERALQSRARAAMPASASRRSAEPSTAEAS